MAFRATNLIPAEEYERAKRLAIQVQRLADARAIEFATGATSAEILALVDNLSSFKTGLQAAKDVPGIVDYAIAQEDDPLYNVATEFTAMIAAITAVIDEVVTTLPTDVNDWLLINKIELDGSLTPRSFSGAALATIISLLTALSATIV